MMHIPDGRLVIVGAQRVQVRSSRSRVRIMLWELFLIWLGGRITSPRVWFGAGGQGVTLKLAWGPSNSSPWICILFLCFCCLFHFSSFYHHFMPCFFPLFFWAVVFSRTVLVRVGCIFPFFFSKSGVTSFSLFMSLLLLLPLIHFF